MFSKALTEAKKRQSRTPKMSSNMVRTLAEVGNPNFIRDKEIKLGDEPITDKEYAFLKHSLQSYRKIG